MIICFHKCTKWTYYFKNKTLCGSFLLNVFLYEFVTVARCSCRMAGRLFNRFTCSAAPRLCRRSRAAVCEILNFEWCSATETMRRVPRGGAWCVSIWVSCEWGWPSWQEHGVCALKRSASLTRFFPLTRSPVMLGASCEGSWQEPLGLLWNYCETFRSSLTHFAACVKRWRANVIPAL